MTEYGDNIKSHVLFDVVTSAAKTSNPEVPVLPHGDAASLQGVPVSDETPEDGDALIYNAEENVWEFGSVASDLGSVLTKGNDAGAVPLLNIGAATGGDLPTSACQYQQASSLASTAKSEAIEASAEDATTKAAAAVVSANAHSDSLWKEFDVDTETSSCSSGGTVSGSIDLGVTKAHVGRVLVQALSDSRSATIKFYADPGMTNLLYETPTRNCYNSPYHDDNTPWSFKYNLTDGLIYYNILNSHANSTAYVVTLKGYGR